MTAKWIWNTVNIYVSDEETAREIKRAEIFKLDNTESSYHFFGAGSRKISLKGMVIGDTDRNSLFTDAINDTARTFTTPYGSLANCKINGTPKFSYISYTSGTIDGTTYSVDTTPIYNCDLEIIL